MEFHALAPGVCLHSGFVHKAFLEYLRDWREDIKNNADDGVISASECLQSVLIDLVLNGRLMHDWLSIMEELLTKNNIPIAYSESFGGLLHGFSDQYLQSTIQAIHTRWWIERLAGENKVDHDFFAKLVLSKKQPNGLIYDSDVSETTLRHRMKAELTLSAALSTEILVEANFLNDPLRDELASSLCDPSKVPPLGYMTSEQFRLSALKQLSHEEQFPVGISEHISACEVGLEYGWNDFAVASKVDAYMGTAKRVSRDKAIHSPLVACHVAILSGKVDDQLKLDGIVTRFKSYARYLNDNPTAIPAYQMRDVPTAFGTDITPLEAICASWLINKFSSGDSQ